MNTKQKMIRYLTTLLGIALVFGVSGCGVKKDPAPLFSSPSYILVTDLSHALAGNTAILKWTAPVADIALLERIKGFTVYRSASKLTNGQCDNCPIIFKRVTEIAFTADDAGKEMSHGDTIEQGYRYVYKVSQTFSDSTEELDSNIIQFDYH